VNTWRGLFLLLLLVGVGCTGCYHGFSIYAPETPPKPINPSQHSITCNSDITFEWFPNEAPTPYIFQLSDRSSFASYYVYDPQVLEPEYAMTLPSDTYYWRVASQNEDGLPIVSPTYTFMILETPVIQAIAEVPNTCTKQIEFTFQSNIDVGYFKIELSASSNFQTDLVKQYDGSDTDMDIRSPFRTPDTFDYGSYFWRVLGVASGCEGIFSSPTPIVFSEPQLDHFEFTMPTSMTEHEPISVTITAYDSDQNVFTCYDGTPELTLNPIWGNLYTDSDTRYTDIGKVVTPAQTTLTLSDFENGSQTLTLMLNRATLTGEPQPRLQVTDGDITSQSDSLTVLPLEFLGSGGTALIEPTTGTWDEDGVQDPTVFFLGDIYEIFYSGYGAGVYQIGRARSSTGLGFSKDPSPILTAEAGNTHASQPAFLFYQGIYHIWYTETGASSAIWHASSTDGSGWSKNPAANGVLVPGITYGTAGVNFPEAPALVHDSEGFLLWFVDDYQLGVAESTDGISFSNITYPIPGMGDGTSFASPEFVKDGNVYKCWYVNSNGLNYATSLDPGSGWKQADQNPIQTQQFAPEIQLRAGTWYLWYHGPDSAIYLTTP
jgi:hypothetical protein